MFLAAFGGQMGGRRRKSSPRAAWSDGKVTNAGEIIKDPSFRAEYAPSARAKCRCCKEKVAKGKLRIATLKKSKYSDEHIPRWFCARCFWKQGSKPQCIEEIQGFYSLEYMDQMSLYAFMGQPQMKAPALPVDHDLMMEHNIRAVDDFMSGYTGNDHYRGKPRKQKAIARRQPGYCDHFGTL